MIKKGDIWFTAVMLRGFIELYHLDKNKTYLDAFNKSLDYAWENARDEKGLFHTDLSGNKKTIKMAADTSCHDRDVQSAFCL